VYIDAFAGGGVFQTRDGGELVWGSPTAFHGLRHCHVSQLIAANVNIKTIQQRVGHTTIKTTLDTYGHLLPGMDEEAAEAIEGTISL